MQGRGRGSSHRPWEVDLDQLAAWIGWSGKHADKLIIGCGGRVIVAVEETSRPKLDDVEKLESTLEETRHGLLREALQAELGLDPAGACRFVAVLHSKRRLDPMLYKALYRRSRGDTVYLKVPCGKELWAALRRYMAC